MGIHFSIIDIILGIAVKIAFVTGILIIIMLFLIVPDIIKGEYVFSDLPKQLMFFGIADAIFSAAAIIFMRID